MMDSMHRDDLVLALNWLALHPETDPDTGRPYPTRLPYDTFPGQTPDSIIDLNTRDAWNWYQWNPPEYLDHAESQADCMAKPTWEMLLHAIRQVQRLRAIKRLDAACESRITQGYGANTSQAEWHFRLRAAEAGASEVDKQRLTAGNAERDRLRARYRAITARINTITDLDTLRGLDFSDDDYWSATWSPPA